MIRSTTSRKANMLTTLQRMRAARMAANTDPACLAIRPFYWEIGDSTSRYVGDTAVDASGDGPFANTVMPIASASKWVWGAYMLARGLSLGDVAYLNFTSGYCNLVEENFPLLATVDDILYTGSNGVQSPDAVGKFFYNGGHMQMQAHLLGLGPLRAGAFSQEVQSRIGDFGFTYSAPVPAGSIRASGGEYGGFLRALLNNTLRMGYFLGAHPVPTQGPEALSSPTSYAWHYSLGHWVEDDPTGDGSFSSPGTFGFYPWIDASKTWYGLIARTGLPGAGQASVEAGKAIRKAWMTGSY